MTPRATPRPRALFRPQWTLTMAAALAAIGFVATAQWNSSLARGEFISSAQGVLVNRAEQLQAEQGRLLTDIQEAETELQSLQERALGSEAELGRELERLQLARVAAGAVEMRGPGVVIEISDSLRTVPPGAQREHYLVLDSDLRDIVTALWASGAEAISISGSLTAGAPSTRLVSTTAIIGTGGGIFVNGVALSPPFRVQAIGGDGLHDRFLAHQAFISRVERRIDTFELQFAIEASGEVTVPGFVGNTRMNWGAPLQGPD
jgi:uncharacterized protein YlxW (UPF0749 family)